MLGTLCCFEVHTDHRITKSRSLTCVTSHTYHLYDKKSTNHFPSTDQEHNMFLTTVSMLTTYFCLTEILYPLTNISHRQSPQLLGAGNHHSTLSFYEIKSVIFHTREKTHFLFSCAWLASFSMSSRFISVNANDTISFF